MEIEGQTLHPTRRAILAGAMAIPLISCNFGQGAQEVVEAENPIGNQNLPLQKNWYQIFIELETNLIQSVNSTIERVDSFESELRQMNSHHLAHLQVFSSVELPQEVIFNSKSGNGLFGELANLRIRHSRSLNFIKNSLSEITDPQLISTITQIAACDNQIVLQLADLMARVTKVQDSPEVTSG